MTQLRPARSTDAGAIGAILTEFCTKTPWMPLLHSGAEDIAHAGAMIARGWVTVAEVDGQVAGFSAADADEVNALYVAAGHRRAGIGGALLQRLQGANEVLKLWTFQVNRPALAFYQAHGFYETARSDGADNDEQLPDVQMMWQREK